MLSVVLAACSARPPQCQYGGDAGTEPRQAAEPCSDGTGCVAGLSCFSAGRIDGVADLECLAWCGDGGPCAAGTICSAQVCRPPCASEADCPGRFARACLDGVCVARRCAGEAPASPSCPTGHCVLPMYCCGSAGPCPVPPAGACLR